jgi:SNF2 family DNA or RNA helicase
MTELWTPNQSLDFVLKDFQDEDVGKLYGLERALIANEMGSGKTYEAVALDILRRQVHEGMKYKKTLIICPLSTVVDTWVRHYVRLAPELKGYFIDPKDQDGFIRAMNQDYDYYIIHWEGIRTKKLAPALQKMQWFHIIADEVHKIKNRKAVTTISLKRMRTMYRTGMSGTPVANKVDDFWSILNWLDKRTFGSYWRFFNMYVESVVDDNGFRQVKGPNLETLPLLHSKIEPWYVFHLKKEQCCEHHPNGVMSYLPDKYYDEIWVELSPQQKRAYKQMSDDMLSWIGEHEDQPLPAPVVLAKLVRLQQFAVAHAYIGEDGRVVLDDPSSKLDAVMELIEENPDKKFVVFSQFTQLVELLGRRMAKAGTDYTLFTGKTPQGERSGIIRRFQEGPTKVFASNMKAGGVGIDLFAASTVIFLDRDWSPVFNSQAEDRLWRHGQENAVQVIDIRARGTVDLGRWQDLQQKWEWIKHVVRIGNNDSSLTP